MTTHKVYVDTESLSKEELEQLLVDKEKENIRLVQNLAEYKNEITDLKEENKKLKKELNKLEDVKKLLRKIVMDLTKLDKLKKIVFKDDADLED